MLQKGGTHVRETGSSVEKRLETRLGDGGILLQGLVSTVEMLSRRGICVRLLTEGPIGLMEHVG